MNILIISAKIVLFCVLIFFSLSQTSWAASLSLSEFAKKTVYNYLTNKNNPKTLSIKPLENFHPVIGVFVTIKNDSNVTRGCWGDLYPQGGLRESIEKAAIHAVKTDYRKGPISISELPMLSFQVTLVKKIDPIASYAEINPFIDGLLVRSSQKSAIILPGEATDPYYQMIMAKVKAGISEKESYTLFRLVSNVYKER